jgi:hypothetical protein
MKKVFTCAARDAGRYITQSQPRFARSSIHAVMVMAALLLLATTALSAQTGAPAGGSTSGTGGMATWQAVALTPEIVAFFENLFERIGIVVTDTGERFTVLHRGDRIDFEPGITGPVDYTVEITTLQVERLAVYARTGRIPEEEQYRVMKVFFTPATAALLAQPLLSSCWVRCFSGAEDVIHVTLRSPLPSEENASHTLLYVRGSWVVVPGLYGHPQRIYSLTLQDAIVYQKNAVAAVKSGDWMRYAQWYREWRKAVSRKP